MFGLLNSGGSTLERPVRRRPPRCVRVGLPGRKPGSRPGKHRTLAEESGSSCISVRRNRGARVAARVVSAVGCSPHGPGTGRTTRSRPAGGGNSMKRIHGLAAIALLGAAALFSFGVPAEAATPPQVTAITEERDALNDRPYLVITGKRLTKFVAFELVSMDGPGMSMTELVSRKGTRIVLGLSNGTPPGEYTLTGLLATPPNQSYPVTIRN